ncbi:hypothetical protein F5890DRAFT_1540692 [Lentinula detonsa]|uniref:Secreted protein n=1 Tax=Lentinula detonsa TaxID=2804962 RepID=A0AA38UNI0_9AGAR|nr:hypothetical protein F5890DRAFT_1540692 [Lentinula detonsa]
MSPLILGVVLQPCALLILQCRCILQSPRKTADAFLPYPQSLALHHCFARFCAAFRRSWTVCTSWKKAIRRNTFPGWKEVERSIIIMSTYLVSKLVRALHFETPILPN